MLENNFDDINEKIKDDEHEKKKPHPHAHEAPPHILKEIMDLKEKVGRLEGKMEVLLSLKK